MQQRISPASAITGAITLPGDKSISHRYAMISAIADGESRIHNYSTGADCHSTLGCVRALGIEVEVTGTEVLIKGKGLDGLRAPAGDLDAGNSGSTIRMLSGILAAQPFVSRIFGDESLSRRPMQRIMRPLAEMGAQIRAREDKFPPLEIHGARLRPIDYTLPVPSAQVKTCVLFARTLRRGRRPPSASRWRRAITPKSRCANSAPTSTVAARQRKITLAGRPHLTGRELMVPSRSLLGGVLHRGRAAGARIAAHHPRRRPESDALRPARFSDRHGRARFAFRTLESRNGELIGDIVVQHSDLQGGTIEGALTAALIDEIPVLAVLGAATEEGLTVRDAGELRVKETDRIRTVVENLRRTRRGGGRTARRHGDSRAARSSARPSSISFGDHRIAMAFAVAALRADGESVIEGAEAASVSFPEFWSTLARIADGKSSGPGRSRAAGDFTGGYVFGTQLQDQRVQRDRLLNVAPDQHRRFRRPCATALRIQANCTLAASASSSRRIS